MRNRQFRVVRKNGQLFQRETNFGELVKKVFLSFTNNLLVLFFLSGLFNYQAKESLVTY